MGDQELAPPGIGPARKLREPASQQSEHRGSGAQDYFRLQGVPDRSGLTELFERAKFAPHPVDGAMKRDAIASLESIAAELAETGR